MSDCKLCGAVRCDSVPDISLYSLEDNVLFNPAYSFVVECPPGYKCAAGTFPQTIIIPAGTFELGIPPSGSDGTLTLQCCESALTYSTAGLSADQIQALAAQMLFTCAQQQAACDGVNNTVPAPVPSVTYLNQAVYAQFTCPTDQVVDFTGTLPGWINLNTGTGQLFVYPGIFSGSTQAEANATAQTLLNDWLAARIADGSMGCTAGFQNVIQSYGCPSGYADINRTNVAINGDGLYVSDGTAYAAAGYFTSYVSQADADAQALTAATDYFNAYVSAGTIDCQPTSPCGTTAASVQAASWSDSTYGLATADPVVDGDVATWNLEVTATQTSAQFEKSATICNPGAAYDLTVSVPADSSGSVDPSTHIVDLTVVVDGILSANDEQDPTTFPKTLSVTLSLTPGTHIINIFVSFSAIGAPTAQCFQTAAMTIRPLTPP